MRLRNKRITPFIFEKHFPNQRRNERRLSSFPEANLIGNTTSYSYNYMGLVATETNEKNATRYYSYDALGRLVSKTDRNGRITTYSYDTIGRLTSENWSDTTNYFMYTYDAVGNLLYATDGQHSYSYTYDALNRPIYTTFNFDSQSAVFAYTYDLAGRRTSSSLSLNGHSDRANQVTYDFLGNATSIRQTGSAVDEIFAEFDYNANGLMTSVKRYEVDGNNLINEIAESVYTYNANNAVTSITHKNPNGTQIVQHSYTYDNTNNIVEYLNSIDGQTTYDYDFLGQLIGADYANGSISDENYTYDENGNRVTANGDTYTTGTNNELTSDGDFTYTYDAEGNRISKTNAANTERELYTWDYRNRLTTVTKQTYDTLTNEWTTVQTVEYSYDYNNVWIRKTLDTNGDGIADSKTIFIPENYQTTVQLDDTDLTDATGPVVTHHYLWTPNQQDKLLADTTTSGILWALTDHLGTIRDVLDDNSSTHLIYDAFGNLTSGTNPILFGYTGKAFDPATNLQNNINRWYNATTGRWLSTDPIGFEGNDTNLYRYVNNNPFNGLDILGLEENQECKFLIFIGDNKYIWNSMHEHNLLSIKKPNKKYPDPQSEHWSIPEGTFIDGYFCWAGDFFEELPNRDTTLIRKWETMPRNGVGKNEGMVPYIGIQSYVNFILYLAKEKAKILRENGCCNNITINFICTEDAIKKIDKQIRKLTSDFIKPIKQTKTRNMPQDEHLAATITKLETLVSLIQWSEVKNLCEGKTIEL